MSNGKKRARINSPWFYAVLVFAIITVGGLLIYWISQPSSEEQLDVWVGFPGGLKKEVRTSVEEIVTPYGIKKINFGTYNPSDRMYSQAFAIRAQYTDVYVLTKEEAEAVASTGQLFAVVDGATEGITDSDGNVVAVPMVGEMYVAYNKLSKKDVQMLKQIVDYLVSIV